MDEDVGTQLIAIDRTLNNATSTSATTMTFSDQASVASQTFVDGSKPLQGRIHYRLRSYFNENFQRPSVFLLVQDVIVGINWLVVEVICHSKDLNA